MLIETEITTLTRPVLELTMNEFMVDYRGDINYYERQQQDTKNEAAAASRRGGRRRYDGEDTHTAPAPAPPEEEWRRHSRAGAADDHDA